MPTDTMSIRTIDGKDYYRMLLGALGELSGCVEELNSLNVFPVADGDTGTNMTATLGGGIERLQEARQTNIGELMHRFSRGVLLSARGNSGVILSQIFAGIAEGLSDSAVADTQTLARAYRSGVEKSYAAVAVPHEGTILTVFRESTEYAADNAGDDLVEFFKLHIEEARRSLERTPELLPALKEAGVVDSGALGYLRVAEGMYRALTGEEIIKPTVESPHTAQIDIDRFTRDSTLDFGYCTEFLLRLQTAKCDPDSLDIEMVRGLLGSLGGESVVAYKDGDIVKVHVHTRTPGEVLAAAQRYGEFLTVKIENMSLGHTGEKRTEKKKKPFSVVAVSSGEGISALFSDMGAVKIVDGGQSHNPSVEDFLAAFDECSAENIIVLPNNKNILLAARGAAEIYTEARVHVLESRSFTEGYLALSVINPAISDIDALLASAERAMGDAAHGEITRAVRDAVVNGKEIKCGDYMAIAEGEIKALAGSAEEATEMLLESLDAELCEIITVFSGGEVDPDRAASLAESIKKKYPDCELSMYEGGQEVYDYLVCVE